MSSTSLSPGSSSSSPPPSRLSIIVSSSCSPGRFGSVPIPPRGRRPRRGSRRGRVAHGRVAFAYVHIH
jgi:hypothetical protein